jgi:hypothetical protein
VADRQFLVMPMPPCVWIAFWPTNFAPRRNLGLALRYGGHALVRGLVEVQRGIGRHRLGLLDLHEHVDHAVLQHLEAGNGLAELLRCFE